jgi:release factor glutamine methyltransferase
MPESIKQALSRADSLQSRSESWQLDSELLLAHALGKPREYLFTWPDKELSDTQLNEYQEFLCRRGKGEPIAYILGRKEFWDFELVVNYSVLIPRPETELLVEIAIDILRNDERAAVKVADLGTGSGAIALALARSLADIKVIAVDLSEDALQVAATNAERLDVANIEFIQSSWCDGLQDKDFDMIVSNPPYVAEGDSHLDQGDLPFEPALALTAAGNGLADIQTITSQTRDRLKSGGWLLLEHGYDQREAVADILGKAGFSDIRCLQDLAGVDRVSLGRLTGPAS